MHQRLWAAPASRRQPPKRRGGAAEKLAQALAAVIAHNEAQGSREKKWAVGEHVEGARFRVVRISVQPKGGSLAWFTRSLRAVVAPLRSFFKKTNYDYGRFNYLGEWHSHPLFALLPSQTDGETMQTLVSDPSVKARFAVLLLVRLGPNGEFQAAATLFARYEAASEARLVMEL